MTERRLGLRRREAHPDPRDRAALLPAHRPRHQAGPETAGRLFLGAGLAEEAAVDGLVLATAGDDHALGVGGARKGGAGQPEGLLRAVAELRGGRAPEQEEQEEHDDDADHSTGSCFMRRTSSPAFTKMV